MANPLAKLLSPIHAAYRALLAWVVQAATLVGRLIRRPMERRRLVMVVAASLVAAYAIGVFGYVLTVPDIGLRFAFSRFVNRAYPQFIVASTQEAPKLEEAEVVQVGPYKIEVWPQLLRATMDLRREPVQAFFHGEPPDTPLTLVDLDGEKLVKVQYREHGRGPIRWAWCRLGSPPLEDLTPALLWLFLKAGLFAVGMLVFWKRPGDRSAAQFFLLCTVTFGAYIGGYHWWHILTQPVLLLIFMSCSVLLPAVSLHFYLVFPRPKAFLVRRPLASLALIYGLPVGFLTLLVVGYAFIRLLFQGGAAVPGAVPQLEVALKFVKDVIAVCLGVSSLWYVACVVCLIHSYRTAHDGTERNQVKWILLGALAAMVPLGYSLYLAYFDVKNFGGGGATWPMFAASTCFTVAFTVSITRYRLMQLNEIITSGMVYFLISTAAGLVYYALVFLVMLLVGAGGIAPSFTQALWVSGSTLVLVLLLDLARSRVKAALDKHFHREKHQLDKTLHRLSVAVQQLVDPEALARRLLEVCSELLAVTRAAVYLRSGDPPIFQLVDSLGEAPPLAELSSGCPLVEALRQRSTVLLRPSESGTWWSARATSDGPANGGPPRPAGWPLPTTAIASDPARRQLQFLGGEAAQALTHEGQLLALLVLGPKARGQYGPDDLNLLAAIAQITALALVGAEGRRTIETLNRDLQAKVEKIGEQQRRILVLQSQLMKQGIHRSPDGERKDAPTSEPGEESDAHEHGIIGSSAQVQQLLQLVKKVSASEMAVLLRGESGTGKELLARALHENSPRAGKPYVKVHCAALSPSLLESELFGHVKGAFTGAHRDKVGRFELADGGTLFLDEIGDISLEVQTKLLRVLQEKTFERVGSSDPVRVDVRVVAATHQDLDRLIEQGRFREDLFYRLNGFPIYLPPLRERREDIPELALHFLRQYSRRSGKAVETIEDDALACLKAYSWPGNIRQLENVMERAVVIAEKPAITEEELPPEIVEARLLAESADDSISTDRLSGGIPTERAERDRQEKERLVRALAAAGGNKAEAARALGLARSTLLSRLKRLGLS